jgi:hypothetical protein
MNAIWPKASEQALGGQTKTAVTTTDDTAASVDAAPVATTDTLVLSAPRSDEQVLQLLQANRKLEAQLKVRPVIQSLY